MIDFARVQQFIARSRRETSADALADGFADLVADAGITEFLVCSLRNPTNLPADAIWIDRYNPDWMRIYLSQRYCEIDPIFRAARTEPLPFFWHEFLNETSSCPRQRRWREDVRAFGYADGMTVPVHAAGHHPGCIALAAPVPIDRTQASTIHLLSIYMFDGARRLRGGPPAGRRPRHGLLTPREAECLRWAAQGRSIAQTGELLALSEATVRFHLSNVRRKYGVTTTAQAVAFALRRKEIEI